jgi:hypothetical protein
MSALGAVNDGHAMVHAARERLRELDTDSIIDLTLNWLQRPPDEGFEWYERLPFIAFLIVKWAGELWNEGQEGRRQATGEDFDFIFNNIWEANGRLVSPLPRSIGLRRLAFQQFWYQQYFDVGSLPRQALIFGRYLASSEVTESFREQYGMTPTAFVRQLMRLCAQLGNLLDRPALRALSPTPRDSDDAEWGAMRAAIMVDLPALHARMRAIADRSAPRDLELCEQSPLIRCPVLVTPRGDQVIHHQLLYRCMETALYDLMRAQNAERFMRHFGPAFEDYLAEVLGELDAQVIRETELKQRLIGQGKCVDFAVVSDDILLLVDAKGIEGHYDELYHSLPDVLTAKLRTTALHATDQAVETVQRLPEDLRRPTTVFLCVTFKQLNIGDGEALRDLTTGTEEHAHGRWSEPSLPPNHMVYPSVSEFELLCGAVRAGVPLGGLLRRIVLDNQSPDTSRFLMSQHLARLGEVNIPDCAANAARELCGLD